MGGLYEGYEEKGKEIPILTASMVYEEKGNEGPLLTASYLHVRKAQ